MRIKYIAIITIFIIVVVLTGCSNSQVGPSPTPIVIDPTPQPSFTQISGGIKELSPPADITYKDLLPCDGIISVVCTGNFMLTLPKGCSYYKWNQSENYTGIKSLTIYYGHTWIDIEQDPVTPKDYLNMMKTSTIKLTSGNLTFNGNTFTFIDGTNNGTHQRAYYYKSFSGYFRFCCVAPIDYSIDKEVEGILSSIKPIDPLPGMIPYDQDIHDPAGDIYLRHFDSGFPNYSTEPAQSPTP